MTTFLPLHPIKDGVFKSKVLVCDTQSTDKVIADVNMLVLIHPQLGHKHIILVCLGCPHYVLIDCTRSVHTVNDCLGTDAQGRLEAVSEESGLCIFHDQGGFAVSPAQLLPTDWVRDELLGQQGLRSQRPGRKEYSAGGRFNLQGN